MNTELRVLAQHRPDAGATPLIRRDRHLIVRTTRRMHLVRVNRLAARIAQLVSARQVGRGSGRASLDLA